MSDSVGVSRVFGSIRLAKDEEEDNMLMINYAHLSREIKLSGAVPPTRSEPGFARCGLRCCPAVDAQPPQR